MVYWNLIPIRLSAQCPPWYPRFRRRVEVERDRYSRERKGRGKKKKRKKEGEKKKWNDKWAERWKSRSFQNGRNKIRVPFILEEIENERRNTNSSVIPLDRNSTNRSEVVAAMSFRFFLVKSRNCIACLEIERSRMDETRERKPKGEIPSHP